MLGRSDLIRRLFDYFVACASEGRVPKEIEVAIDGFGRAADFDVSQDAMVRVYVHKLRRKLEDYYARPGAAAGGVLRIPRGEYRLVLDAASEAAPVEGAAAAADLVSEPPQETGRTTVRERWLIAAAVVLSLVCAVLLADRWREPPTDPVTQALRSNALWAPLLADELPIQIVLGDYYIFGERDDGRHVSRLVRDFDINSRADLELRQKAEPGLVSRYEDLNLGYLPTSSAQALRSVLPILTGAGKGSDQSRSPSGTVYRAPFQNARHVVSTFGITSSLPSGIEFQGTFLPFLGGFPPLSQNTGGASLNLTPGLDIRTPRCGGGSPSPLTFKTLKRSSGEKHAILPPTPTLLRRGL